MAPPSSSSSSSSKAKKKSAKSPKATPDDSNVLALVNSFANHLPLRNPQTEHAKKKLPAGDTTRQHQQHHNISSISSIGNISSISNIGNIMDIIKSVVGFGMWKRCMALRFK
eukprot:GHVT01062246.1.p4 GENE.GHVT01062246.1~~GHVT01062246.1.p4  ORF type:complete len:112 (+),score=33.40 GHVT01062246.1:3269-3604(+)